MANRIILNPISYHGRGAVESIVPEVQARGLKKDAPTSPASVASSSSTPSSKTKDLGHVCGVCPWHRRD